MRGVRRTKDYEKVITVGMPAMATNRCPKRRAFPLLERIVADQRQIITRVVPRMSRPCAASLGAYKSGGYYEKGMRVPNDVTCSGATNWGISGGTALGAVYWKNGHAERLRPKSGILSSGRGTRLSSNNFASIDTYRGLHEAVSGASRRGTGGFLT